MSNNKNTGSLDEQKIASFLQEQVKRVEGASNAQIDELKQVAKLFKKNVPLSRRSYVLAQLVKNASGFARGERGRKGDRPLKGERGDRPQRADRGASFEHTDRLDRTDRVNLNERADKFERTGRAARGDRRDVSPETREDERRERPPRVTLDPALSDTIFVGIGKTRSVHPRDIVGLLVGVAGLERGRIGDIRVLSNYSFVQLYSQDCQKAIDALDGYEYRGRKLGVSFSRKKGEDELAVSTKPASSTAQDTVEQETPSADQVDIEPTPQQEGSTPAPSTDGSLASGGAPEEAAIKGDSSGETPSEATGGDGAAEAQPQAEIPVQNTEAQSETAQVAAEGFETSDDGQVRSHFGDGAAY